MHNKVKITDTHSQHKQCLSPSSIVTYLNARNVGKIIYRQIRPSFDKDQGSSEIAWTTIESFESFLLELTDVSDEGKKERRGYR